MFVSVSDRVWVSALDSLREKIINTINQHAGSVLVNRIVFQESSVADLGIKKPTKEKKSYSLEQNKIQTLKSEVGDQYEEYT